MGDPVKLNGSFGFEMVDGQVRMSVKDLLIDGLPIKRFTAAWVGMAVAEGVMNAVGGMVFSALVNALLKSEQPSMQDLLHQQMMEFAHMLRQTLEENKLRECQNHLRAFITSCQDYSNNPILGTLDFVENNSEVLIEDLRSLSVAGYSTFMVAAGLALTIKQERIQLNRNEGANQNFRNHRSNYIAHHNQIESLSAHIRPR